MNINIYIVDMIYLASIYDTLSKIYSNLLKILDLIKFIKKKKNK